jgi:AraC-like DNA-binding protein
VIALPVNSSYTIQVAGRFLMPVLGQMEYIHETFALHQYGYSGQLLLGSQQFILRPGDITLTPPGVRSVYRLPSCGFHLCLHFSVTDAGAAKCVVPFYVPTGRQADFFSHRLWALIDLQRQIRFHSASQWIRAAQSAGLEELIIRLQLLSSSQNSIRTSREAEDALNQVVASLEIRCAEPLTVSKLAKEVGLSQNHLARLFRRRYGMTIRRFLVQRRLELTRHLLITTDLPIKAIADLAGLFDAHHLNKLFRRAYGSSPSEFRLRSSVSR